jgi:electron transfer flavoprotein alpha subunit
MSEILVYCGHRDGKLFKSSFDLLGGARKIAAGLNCRVSASVIGGEAIEGCVETLAAYGAHKVYLCTDGALEQYNPELYLSAFQTVCRLADPRIVLFVSDTAGRELAPRLAYRQQTGIMTDCIRVEVDEGGGLTVYKPVYGGKAIAEIKAEPVQVITIRQKCFEPMEKDEGKTAETVVVAPDLSGLGSRVKLVEFAEEKAAGPRLEEARVIVSGGRGIGGKEPFDELEKLAGLLDGAVGSSRAAVDAGWVPPSYQVGQTGKIVGPDLYLAIGISGASQHLAGISRSKCIVAVNKDQEAPIFRIAHFGIVDDYKTILPEMMRQVEKMVG